MYRTRCLAYCVFVCIIVVLLSMIYQLESMTSRLRDTYTLTAIESDHPERPTLLHSDPTLMIDDSEARALSKAGGRLLCWILSTPTSINTKVAAVNSTWLKRCDGHVLFVEDVPPPVPPDVVSLDVPRGYYNLTAKVVIILQHLYTHFMHQYDWFLKADDDAYVIVENLRYILSRYQSTEPVYLGHLYKLRVPQGYMSGGATYVLSKGALRTVVEEGYQKNKCRRKGKYEDVEVGDCLHKVGIHAHNTRDRFGRDTFHPLKPAVHIVGPIPADQLPQDRFAMVSGDDCCSQLTVSFHKVTPDLMKIVDHLLYRTSVYGRILDTKALNDIDLVQPKLIPPPFTQS